MLYREIIAACFEDHTEHANTLCGRQSQSQSYVTTDGSVGQPFLE
jgi:hypothetical protein